jgi:hypothetical protein
MEEGAIILDEIVTEIDVIVFNEIDKVLQEIYDRNTNIKEIGFLTSNVAFYLE